MNRFRRHISPIFLVVILILIFNQPIDKFDSYNAATRRQAPLPGGKPACGRFPRLVLFYLSALPIERLKISIKTIQKIEHNLAYMDYAMIFCL